MSSDEYNNQINSLFANVSNIKPKPRYITFEGVTRESI
jgi:hypothetical protein